MDEKREKDSIEQLVFYLDHPEKWHTPEFRRLLADKEQRELFEDIRLQREIWTRKGLEQRLDVDAEYISFTEKIKQKRRKLYLWSGVAASCAVLFFALFFVIDRPESQPDLSALEISTGRKEAELILETGERLSLGKQAVKVTDHDLLRLNDESALHLQYQLTDSVSDELLRAKHTVKTPTGADYYIELSDGTRVWLNHESSLTFPVKFSPDERRVILEGEAFFEVAKATEWPFIVQTEEMNVQVSGTSFDVRSYAAESVVMTTLISGSVSVNGYELKPSVQFRMNKETRDVTMEEVDTQLYVGWIDGMFVFKGERLEDIMKELSRWYNVDVQFLTPSLKDICFSGNIERYQTIDEMLEIISTFEGISSIGRNGRTVTIGQK